MTSVNPVGSVVPRTFHLYQNFPNPFNPSTVISYRFSSAAGGHVSLIVYDVLGREVARLINARQNPGTNDVTFDASNLPRGVYFYRLQAGGYASTKKLVVVK